MNRNRGEQQEFPIQPVDDPDSVFALTRNRVNIGITIEIPAGRIEFRVAVRLGYWIDGL